MNLIYRKNIWKDELKGQNNEINLLEEQNRQAQTSLKEYASRHKYWSKLEHEKTMIFKEKNKILTQLMNDEKPTLKATTNKRVFDLTKDFLKISLITRKLQLQLILREVLLIWAQRDYLTLH